MHHPIQNYPIYKEVYVKIFYATLEGVHDYNSYVYINVGKDFDVDYVVEVEDYVIKKEASDVIIPIIMHIFIRVEKNYVYLVDVELIVVFAYYNKLFIPVENENIEVDKQDAH